MTHASVPQLLRGMDMQVITIVIDVLLLHRYKHYITVMNILSHDYCYFSSPISVMHVVKSHSFNI